MSSAQPKTVSLADGAGGTASSADPRRAKAYGAATAQGACLYPSLLTRIN